MNHLEHSIETLYDTSIKKLRRREEDIHNKTRVIFNSYFLFILFLRLHTNYQENAVLLSDLNELRIQNKFLQNNL